MHSHESENLMFRIKYLQEAIEKILSEELANKVKEYVEMKDKVQKMQSERDLNKAVRKQNREIIKCFKKQINEVISSQDNVGCVEKQVFLQRNDNEVDQFLL